jgi:MFS family permease
MGVLGGATTLAVAVYPTIGGFLADVSWELPFYLYGVSTLLALGFVGYGLGLVGAGLAPNPALITGALVAFGVGHGLTFPNSTPTSSTSAGNRSGST